MSLLNTLTSIFARKMATFKGHIKKDKKLGRIQPTYEKPINYIRRIDLSNNYAGALTRVGISGKNMKEWAPRAQA